MTSQQPAQAANNNDNSSATTAADELSRFTRYVDFKTRDLRHTVATYLGTNATSDISEFRVEDNDEEDLFVHVGEPEEDWVGVADEAVEVSEDPSQEKYQPTPPPAPGPIQQTSIATQRATLQTLGLTGTYLEHGFHLVAEDVGWLTHTATFEDAMAKVQRRFPMLTRLGESYGKGAKRADERRHSSSSAVFEQGQGQTSGVASSKRLTDEEVERFGELEEVSPQAEGDEWGDWHYGKS